MKARVKASNDLWFEADAETEEELFKQVARVQEIFQHGLKQFVRTVEANLSLGELKKVDKSIQKFGGISYLKSKKSKE